jgi:murein DD-endopeptidase MepM/ murein hydrolase activator NlpD
VRRSRWKALLLLGSIAAFVVVLFAAFGASSPRVSALAPAGSSRLLPSGPPRPQVIAVQGRLRLQLPIAQTRVTAIGYHGAGTTALPLDPVGRRANAGLFSRAFHRIFGGGGKPGWFQLGGGGGGPSTGAADVGAAEGTDVYSPVQGTVVGIHPYVIDGRKLGNVLEIQPENSPNVVVELSHLEADRSLAVGSTVAAGVSKVGRVLDFSQVERQALARHTQDVGNHVTLVVRAAAGAES